MPKAAKAKSEFFRGRVIFVSVKGLGPNSGELLFSIAPPKGQPRSFVALTPAHSKRRQRSDLWHESRVFAAMTSLLAAMYGQEHEVLVEYVPTASTHGSTDVAVAVQVPAT